jgi:hypothetical protein
VTESGSPQGARLFPIQLDDVYSVSARAERRDQIESDGAPEAKGSRVSVSNTPLSADERRFRCRLEVSLSAPVLDQEVAELTLIVQGNYRSDEPITQEALSAFVQGTPLVQLWPYARAYLAELGRIVGVGLPPLPLIDVTRPGLSTGTPVEPADDSDG